ncbi:SpdA protein, partial [Roseomonas aerophila]|nr:SpdA protein [Pseudoroseomonas aerophila]
PRLAAPAGTAVASGTPAAPPAQRVDVRVQLPGAPPGTVVTTRTAEGVRVERPMAGAF